MTWRYRARHAMPTRVSMSSTFESARNANANTCTSKASTGVFRFVLSRLLLAHRTSHGGGESVMPVDGSCIADRWARLATHFQNMNAAANETTTRGNK